jgi:endonuclease/exonuclease/phosphatase family metal-dependent hydrolase
MILRLLSFNIHKGADWRGRDRVANLKDAILKSQADIVFLQEIHEKHLIDQVELETLADEIWHDFSYAKNSVNAGGDYGNAILSRFPVIESESLDLTTNRMEKRNIQKVKIDINGFAIDCFNTHLNLLRHSRKKQLDKIIEFVNSSQVDYGVIAGDFNDWRQDSKKFEERVSFVDAYHSIYGEYAKSFPAIFPVLRLDRLMIKGCEVRTSQVFDDHVWRKLSDHLPLFCEIIIPEDEVSNRS